MKKADPDSLPPTSPKTLAVLIFLLLCLMAATFKAALYPSPPAAWQPLHDARAMSVADVNRLLTESGAHIESIKTTDAVTTETWYKNHRTGTWTILIRYTKPASSDVVQSVHIRNDVTHFPAFTRTWDYPETKSPAPAAQPAPAKTAPPPAISAPAQPAPPANAPAK